MPTPSEHKTVQTRILAYAEAIGWTVVYREEAERRRGFDPDAPPADCAKNRTLFFDDMLDAEAGGALPGLLRHLRTDIYGNREFVEHLRNRGKFLDHEVVDRTALRHRAWTAQINQGSQHGYET